MTEEAWGVIELMADKGGWDNIEFGKGKQKLAKDDGAPAKKRKDMRGRKKNGGVGDAEVDVAEGSSQDTAAQPVTGQKRKTIEEDNAPRRRSTRSKK